MKKIVILIAALGLAACSTDADVATQNVKQDADNFKINRRITFINTWTGDYLLVVEGLCSQSNSNGQLAVICKTPSGQYKRHILGLSNNVTFVSEQMEPATASAAHYKLIFKPSVILPTIETR